MRGHSSLQMAPQSSLLRAHDWPVAGPGIHSLHGSLPEAEPGIHEAVLGTALAVHGGSPVAIGGPLGFFAGPRGALGGDSGIPQAASGIHCLCISLPETSADFVKSSHHYQHNISKRKRKPYGTSSI